VDGSTRNTTPFLRKTVKSVPDATHHHYVATIDGYTEKLMVISLPISTIVDGYITYILFPRSPGIASEKVFGGIPNPLKIQGVSIVMGIPNSWMFFFQRKSING
jgi:hypothetical protein